MDLKSCPKSANTKNKKKYQWCPQEVRGPFCSRVTPLVPWWYPSEGWFSDVRVPFRTQNPQTYQTNRPYESCSHFWNIFVICLKECRQMFLNHVPIYSENTTNPNTIFKITISCTKYTKHAKKHSTFWISFEHFEKKTFKF